MKTRAAILVAIVALLLLGTVALAQSGGPDPPTWYTVEQGVASGGGYRLTVLAWQVEGSASGGGYRLVDGRRVADRPGLTLYPEAGSGLVSGHQTRGKGQHNPRCTRPG